MPSIKEKKLKPILKAAILPSIGIGDAVIFLQAAEALKEKGYEVTVIHSSINTLSSIMPSYSIIPRSNSVKDDLLFYDLVIAQYDDSEETKGFLSLRKKHPKFYVFYPVYKKDKHGPLKPFDYASDPKYSMVKNLKNALAKIFPLEKQSPPLLSTNNLTFRKYVNRVIIHPLSKDKKKAWPLKKYLHLATFLKKEGFEPIIVMKPEEEKLYNLEGQKSFCKKKLSDLAALIYESGYFIGNDSGPGHLASLLNIPSLILADDHKRMRLWRPDFYPVKIVTPAKWIPNLKMMRFRKWYWSFFIPVSKVLKEFLNLTKS